MIATTMQEKLAETLKKAGYSLTVPRKALFSALQSGTPRTMRELTFDLASIMDRASIYRTIDLFEELGIVVRVQQGWKYKIELSDIFSPHHHHITCINCNKIVSFDEPEGFESMVNALATSNGFVPKSHNLEISGLCPACQATQR